MDNSQIRLHIPGIPYAITRSEFSHDAYTGKVQRFSPMMRSRGFEVYHYGVETSESGATKHFDLLTKKEWRDLRIKTVKFVEPHHTEESAIKRNDDPRMIISVLSNWNSPLTVEFNKRFREKLKENYRSTKTDIVCVPLGRTSESALAGLDVVKVESGIGYGGSYFDFRVFESYAWMSHTMAVDKKWPPNYWFVVPNYFDTKEFEFTEVPQPKKIGFLGRVTDVKGCGVISEIAKRFPDVEFVLCGQGDDYQKYLTSPNIHYKDPIHGKERSDYLGSCTAVLCLSKFLEPFCGVATEAQLCGTPVICTDHGGQGETVEQFKTGFRGRTLADFCLGVQMALEGKFDRNYIRERAVRNYDMYKLAYDYEYAFRSILDIYNPEKNGWYSPDSHMVPLLNHVQSLPAITPAPASTTPIVQAPMPAPAPVVETKRMYAFIPHYGAVPNYFQLYLDSLAINDDILTVFFITDIDLSSYKLPKNFIPIKMDIDEIRGRLSALLYKTYNKFVAPAKLLVNNYKFVDIKILYPILFEDIIAQYKIKATDFVGWGDCDLIYGKISNFLNLNDGYGIIGGLHGHLTAIENDEEFKNNFTNIPNYFQLVTDNSRSFITDEIAYRQPLQKFLALNKIKMFNTHEHFCDIIPPVFYELWRPDYKNYSSNFFDLYNPKKNIKHVYVDKKNKKSTVYYDNGSEREVLYTHMQKRQMDLPFSSYEDGYYINEYSFSLTAIEKPVEVKKNKHITVLTYCSGYGYDVFARFTESLYKTGFNGDLVFVATQGDVNTLETLKARYKKVSYVVDKLANTRQCQQKRYYLFQDILKNIKSDYVLLTDCRDVFFQRNIEEYETPQGVDVLFAGEGNIIGNCPHNKNWLGMIEKDLQTTIIEKIQNKPIVCSGTTFGTLNGIKSYVDSICEYMSNKIPTDYAGLDQGIHNYLIHCDLLKNINIKILPTEDLLFNTLQYGHKFMNGASQLVNKNKEVSYIVHQWDRLPSYMKDRLPFKIG